MNRATASFCVIALLVLSCARERVQSQGNAPAKEPLQITLPNKTDSVHFAVFGDMGTGGLPQKQVAEIMWQARQIFPYDIVLMTGDNMYGGESPRDYENKFTQPYQQLLQAGVKFYASLGNHDNANQRFFKDFNMNGNEYYTFKKENIRFFALNSNYMAPAQLKWLEEELKNSGSDWKVCFFHHPPYSSGKQHGSDKELRRVVEPLFVKYGVAVVFTGHEHFYERIKPQQGIYYFVTGAGGKLRPGDVKPSQLTEKAFDQDQHFMLIEVLQDEMHFQVISRTGKTIDSGVITRQPTKSP